MKHVKRENSNLPIVQLEDMKKKVTAICPAKNIYDFGLALALPEVAEDHYCLAKFSDASPQHVHQWSIKWFHGWQRNVRKEWSMGRV